MRTISRCRSCGAENLIEFLDLGKQYVSDFREDISRPNKYPLVAVICEECMLVQLKHTTPSEEMYHENYGFKSGVNNSIKADLRDVASTALEWVDRPRRWLDIASNDGTLLSYVPDSIYRVGIDPIKKYCKEAEQKANDIICDFFKASYFPDTKFDVITSISCFYDMDEPNVFVADVEKVLAEKGIWVIQQNYLLTTMQLRAVDNFCHEHLEYYTLLSLEPLLERHGLEVIDLSTSMINGGSLRTVVARKGDYPIQSSVEKQRTIEREEGLRDFSSYRAFASEVTDNLDALKQWIKDVNRLGKTVFILAASTRGSTIWQSAGITKNDVVYAVERNPEKVGKYFSAIGIPIISEKMAREYKPDYMIIGPWFFAEEIVEREQEYLEKGGKLVIPLPKLQIIG